ncbi:poly(A) RNA polymerase GLD2 [Aplysia californica]|uniref:Poly(A) RNA polymerase GLD2 n=1 Tax=Aplysia californica TaxID=6500 RepID=A0ABM0K757_APLCA|nr:poly(A) RNA polymerase GLD2 [Aplysia californica]
MFPARNNFGYTGQVPNLANGFRFQQRSPLFGHNMPFIPLYHMPGYQPMGGMPPRFPVQMPRGPAHANNRGKRRHAPFANPQPSKKARTSDSHLSLQEVAPDEEGKRYKVPVSQGTEKITVAIWNYFLRAQMTDEDLKKKMKLRKSLHTIFEGAFPGCRLFIVGSSMTGFATKSSDVDMCFMISEKEIDQKGDATFILSLIAKALGRCSFVRSPLVIRAKVPILKFEDRNSGVECDLNINNTIGIRNTHLLRHYAYMDWRVRPLMLFIKRWARYHDINDASKKTISSYSLSLMLIHYLQAGVRPAVLPCLQNLQPDMFSSSRDVRKLSLSMEDVVDFSSQNAATLGELFLGFLNYYANVFNYDDVISIRMGKKLNPREAYQCGIDIMQWKNLRIEEPFEGSNTARSVYDVHVFWRILRVIRASFTALKQSRDVDSILSRPF